ncbi:hypothetical protein NVP1284A_32 [Vibrio phage 1.284.A._10N.286.55.A5]|nr:hypothetical protein NVP1284A_32 [Vibrio phage 1.284.A._10N.286.55.A5]AUS01605.1 hypothetical protein NVP1287O_32 [Vibrio phage 1.287.O._10N.286.55.C7]AUS01675.1 hypothetical protein NVP1289A_31 [Vibrio phage 1.289.A._10N.286.55.E8]
MCKSVTAVALLWFGIYYDLHIENIEEINVKNVNEISNGVEVIGFIQSMEFGAILNKQKDGTGIVEYQGNRYQATKEQMNKAVKLPQVKHIRNGMFVIPKRYRQPFGEVTFYQQDEFRLVGDK